MDELKYAREWKSLTQLRAKMNILFYIIEIIHQTKQKYWNSCLKFSQTYCKLQKIKIIENTCGKVHLGLIFTQLGFKYGLKRPTNSTCYFALHKYIIYNL